MSGHRSFTATTWRDGDSWVVEVGELERSAVVARFSQVDAAARDLVLVATGHAPSELVIDLRVPHRVRDVIVAAIASRDDADQISIEAVRRRRALARQLAAEEFAVRDIASLLGVSHGRAQALVAGVVRSPLRRAPRVAPVGQSQDGYRHEALIYRGVEDFLAQTVPFVRDGVALGQPVMIAVCEPRLGLLRTALGPDAGGAIFIDMGELGANPARIIPGWRDFIDANGGGDRPLRGIGEPIWAGRRAAELVECQFHEALLNLAVGPEVSLWLQCPYDATALDESVLTEAAHSHPALVEGEHFQGSTGYGGSHHVETMFRSELPEPGVRAKGATHCEFTDASKVRNHVTRYALAEGLPPQRTADLAVAMTELATNSVRHGGGGGALRMWRNDDAVVCEIRDNGRIDDPLVGRRLVAPEAEGGRGVWLANQLTDLVQVRSTARGTTARVHSWL